MYLVDTIQYVFCMLVVYLLSSLQYNRKQTEYCGLEKEILAK